MKKYYKLFIALLFTSFIVPQIALASWWNPLSWGIFKKKEVLPQVQVEVQKTPEDKISELQRQIDDLKKEQPKPTVTQTPVVKKSATPTSVPATTNNNLDSTCLSFYEKMKALDIPVVKTTPTYTPAELKAIEDAYAGNYNPNLNNIWAKQKEASDLYLNTIRGNASQKESLGVKYGFCYEYLSKAYGFIIN